MSSHSHRPSAANGCRADVRDMPQPPCMRAHCIRADGTAAAHLAPASLCVATTGAQLPLSWLTAVVAVTLALLVLALVISVLSRRFQQRTDVLAQSLAQANAELVLAALHDPLTRLPNRVLLHEHVLQSIDRALHDGQRFAVMLINLDGFKAVNDGYGHQFGDQLLVAVAGRMSAHRRANGSLARLGATSSRWCPTSPTPRTPPRSPRICCRRWRCRSWSATRSCA